jgi:hypothetical protein
MTCLLLALSRSAHRQLAAAILIITFAGQTFATESLEQTINYRIDHVAKSSLISFVTAHHTLRSCQIFHAHFICPLGIENGTDLHAGTRALGYGW